MKKNIKLVQALDKIRFENLYVHSDEIKGICFKTEELNTRKVYMVETLAIINALVDRGTMLLFGGHGGGKTTLAKFLGQMLYGLSKDQIEDCILRGHPQLTEEKILGSLDIAQLTSAKPLNAADKVDVIWNAFIDSPWKIIDEINRLSPYAQNILLSLLAESSVKYHNESKRLDTFSLYATMNPQDVGSYDMSLPFLDRFALAIPITMPDYDSLSTIGKRDKEAKGNIVSDYLQGFDLRKIQDNVKEIGYSEEAELFINVIISSYRLCDRISKESNEGLSVEKDLCAGCHFDAENKVCSKIIHPLSVRVKEDLFRYGKGLAWYLGDDQVSVEHIKAIAPFMIWHRSSLSKKFQRKLKEDIFSTNGFSMNIALDATTKIIALIADEFQGMLPILKNFDKVKRGKLTEMQFMEYISELREGNNNFLITKREIIPIVNQEYAPVYSEIIALSTRIDMASSLSDLTQIKDELSSRYDIPNRHFLAELIDKKRRKVGLNSLKLKQFKVPFESFEENLRIGNQRLYKIINSHFNGNFKPELRRKELIADLADHEFQLEMEKMYQTSDSCILTFSYRGPEHDPIYDYLRSISS